MHVSDYNRQFLAASALVLAVGVLLSQADAQNTAKGVNGVWIDHTGQGAVEIAPCADKVCGRVIWLKNPLHKSKMGKLICGTQVLGDLRQQAAHAWESGWIFNPEDEERFSAALQLTGPNTLLVTGYLGIKLLGETFTWKRATTLLDRCAAANPPS